MFIFIKYYNCIKTFFRRYFGRKKDEKYPQYYYDKVSFVLFYE